MSRRGFLLWLPVGLIALPGLFLIIPAFLPYPALKSLLDSFTSDGNFNSLKPWNAVVFKGLFAAGGLTVLGLSAMSALRPWKKTGAFFRQLGADTRTFFASLYPQKDELGFLAALLAIMALAVIYRLEHVYSPLHHDEAYTYVAFGRSLFSALTDYHLPNNHVFHSILVWLSTRLFGIQPWAVRLPAFLAGVLLVPATYWLARRLYDRWTALAAAFLVAWFPPLIGYANNARGYTLVALFTVLTLALGDQVRRRKNLFAWGLISLFSALGLYTVPVMLFPFGVLFVWLFLEYWFRDVSIGPASYHSRMEFLSCWLAAGLGTALLTILFYLPILVYTGPDKLFANGFVTPLAWPDLLETLSHRFAETWAEWTFRVSWVFILLLIAGWALSLIFHRKISNTRIPLQLAALVWIAALLLIQRPNAWSKVWVFLQPLMLLWAAGGSFGLLQKVHLPGAQRRLLMPVAFGLVLFAGVWQAIRLVPQLPELWAIKGPEEQAVLFVQDQLQEKDLIVVAPTVDAAVWYYSELHGIPDIYFDSRNSDFQRALVLVDLAEGQTPASVIAARGPAPDLLEVNSASLLDTFGDLQVFEMAHK